MAWTGNPEIHPLLVDSLAVDSRIKAAQDAANPGTLEPTQAVVSNGQSITTADGGTVVLTVAGNAITVATYTAGV